METGLKRRLTSGLAAPVGFILFLTAGWAASYHALAQAQETQRTAQSPVARIWHGRVPTKRADEYEAYLQKAGVEKIEAVPGNLGAQLLRRTDGAVTEFMVISYWPSRDAIHAFAGKDIEKTHNLPRDKEFLLEMEPKVKHFDVLHDSRK